MNEPVEVEGQGGIAKTRLARVPARLRESQVTMSAWRLETSNAQATGAIVLVDLPAGPVYRGEGAHLGWPQEKLAALWQELSAPPSDEPPFEVPQLG